MCACVKRGGHHHPIPEGLCMEQLVHRSQSLTLPGASLLWAANITKEDCKNPVGSPASRLPRGPPHVVLLPPAQGKPSNSAPQAAKHRTKCCCPMHCRSSVRSARSQDVPGAARAEAGCANDP